MAIPYFVKKTSVTSRSRSFTPQNLKRYIKFLAVSKDPNATAAVLKTAPDPVIKSVCNAAENVLRGNIRLTPAQKRQFKAKKNLIILLRTKGVSIDCKRKLLSQKGGAFLIPLLISTVLSTLSNTFFKKQE